MKQKFDYSIRTAKETDYAAVNDLYCAWQHHHHKLLPDVFKAQKVKTFIKRGSYISLIEDNNSTVIVATVKRRIVGLIEVIFNNIAAGDDHHYSKQASIEYLYVRSEYRRAGVGRSLLEAAITWSIKKRRTILAVSVYEVNRDAMRLYQKTQFKPESMRLERKLK